MQKFHGKQNNRMQYEKTIYHIGARVEQFGQATIETPGAPAAEETLARVHSGRQTLKASGRR